MRIERVVASSFAEASEISKRQYGADVLLLSSSRVGNTHELLICLDDECSSEELSQKGGQPGDQFGSLLTAELSQRASSRRVPNPVNDGFLSAGRVGDPSAAMGEGLVATIREELRALEFRLSSRSEDFVEKQAMFALLEQGMSAAYATQLMQEGVSLEKILERFVESFPMADLNALLGAERVSVCGPAASGRTTLALQTARLLQNVMSREVSVCAERDTRPGARDRFFAIADTTESEVVWGGLSAAGPAVVDVGGDGHASVSEANARPSEFRVLCLPGFYSRASAAYVIGDGSSWDGVCLTFWSDQVVPLGLLSYIAEKNIPLIGFSSTAAATEPVRTVERTELYGLLRGALSLALDVGAGRLSV